MTTFVHWLRSCVLLLGIWLSAPMAARPILQENMQRATPGDFVVAVQGKTATLLLVYAKEGPVLTLEEVMVPLQRLPAGKVAWQSWLAQHAPGHTCWVRYRLNLASGKMLDYYSFTQKNWFALPQADSLLSTLLALNFSVVPPQERKKIGAQPSVATNDPRSIWQPPLVIDGQTVPCATFEAWRTQWPRDNSELSGRLIEVYLPQVAAAQPAYFPYWLEIQGLTGRFKVRVIDSGRHLTSPYSPL